MINKVDVLSFNWEDSRKKSYNIGMLAQDGEDFYIAFKPINKLKDAYLNGYRGVPGFVNFANNRRGTTPQILKSKKIFDFFERRLLDKKTNDPLSDLMQTEARSMIDSFFLSDDIKEEEKEIAIQKIKRAYKIQEELKRKKATHQLRTTTKV